MLFAAQRKQPAQLLVIVVDSKWVDKGVTEWILKWEWGCVGKFGRASIACGSLAALAVAYAAAPAHLRVLVGALACGCDRERKGGQTGGAGQGEASIK